MKVFLARKLVLMKIKEFTVVHLPSTFHETPYMYTNFKGKFKSFVAAKISRYDMIAKCMRQLSWRDQRNRILNNYMYIVFVQGVLKSLRNSDLSWNVLKQKCLILQKYHVFTLNNQFHQQPLHEKVLHFCITSGHKYTFGNIMSACITCFLGHQLPVCQRLEGKCNRKIQVPNQSVDLFSNY